MGKKSVWWLLALLWLFEMHGFANGEMCELDNVPGATLLLPYFELEIGSPSDIDTFMSIHNASPEPTLAHLTFWTDWGVPTLDYDVFLTGYDVQTFDLLSMFVGGNIAITADEQSDADDSVSPHGDHPEWDGSFTDCSAFFPFFQNPVLSGSILDRIRNGHAGYPVPAEGGECMGQDLNGNNDCAGGCPVGTVARGFVTIDSVNRCSLDFPNEPQYFTDGGVGVVNNRNVLWGDYFILNEKEATLTAFPLVSIEASSAFNADNGILAPSVPSNPNNVTFYGSHTQAFGGDDNREPLGKTWAVRIFADTAGSRSTSFHVWRDPTSSSRTGSYPCGVGPDWNPLSSVEVTCFDEEENAVSLCGPGQSCFPRVAQRVEAADLGLPFSAGWCFFNLGIPADSFPDDVDFPAGGGTVAQSYVNVAHEIGGTFSGGLAAIELTSAIESGSERLLLNLFMDGFESGDMGAWSQVVGGAL